MGVGDVTDTSSVANQEDLGQKSQVHDLKGTKTPPKVQEENSTIEDVAKKALSDSSLQRTPSDSHEKKISDSTSDGILKSPVLKRVQSASTLIISATGLPLKQLRPIAEVLAALKNSPEDKTNVVNCFKELNEYPELDLKMALGDSEFKDILVKHAPILTSNGLKNLFTIVKGEVIAEAKKAVLDCLEKNEKPEGGLAVFQHFTMAVGMSGIQSDEHLAAWGDLAKAYLEIVNKADLSDADKIVAASFAEEIKYKSATGGQTYEWFVLFNDRLSILTTKEDHRNVQKMGTTGPGHKVWDTTGFADYKTKLMQHKQDEKPSWHTADGYIKACRAIGDEFVQTNSSPLGLCKRFPDVVMMPYPFDLNAEELLLSMPIPGKSNFWPLGFIPNLIVADGWKMPPAIFMTHDMFHLTSFLTESDLSDVLFVQKVPPALTGDSELIKEMNKCLFEAITWCQDIVRNGDSQKDQAQMDVFFGFFLFKEGNIGLRRLFDLLTKPGDLGSFIDENNKKSSLFHELTYRLQEADNAAFQYADALPKSLLTFDNIVNMEQQKIVQPATAEQEKEFMDGFKEYGENFLKKFQENRELMGKVTAWINSYDNALNGYSNRRVSRGALFLYGEHKEINGSIRNEWRGRDLNDMPDHRTLNNRHGMVLRSPQVIAADRKSAAVIRKAEEALHNCKDRIPKALQDKIDKAKNEAKTYNIGRIDKARKELEAPLLAKKGCDAVVIKAEKILLDYQGKIAESIAKDLQEKIDKAKIAAESYDTGLIKVAQGDLELYMKNAKL